MTVRKMPSGAWQVRVYRGQDQHGKQLWVYRTVHGGKRDAQRVESELSLDLTVTPASQLTVADAIIAYLERSKDRLAPKTIRSHESLARLWINPTLGQIRLDRLQVTDVTSWIRKMTQQRAPQTVKLAHATLRAALNSAQRAGWIQNNPASAAIEALPSNDPRPLCIPRPEEVQEALGWARENNLELAAAIMLGAACGLRRGEIVGLAWSEVYEDRVELLRTKTRKIRHVAIGEPVAAILEEVRAKQLKRHTALNLPPPATVLSNPRKPSQPAVAHVLDNFFHTCKVALGINWRFHDLRHFHATQLIAAGVDIRTVASRLGHTTPVLTLNTYAHLVDSADRRAADVGAGLLG